MPIFQDWIMKHESPSKAYCKLCSKAINLSNMGKRALTSHAEGKLHKYQIDEPMIMFLAEDLQSMCSRLMHKFVKKSVLDSADTMYKIANLDVLDKQNHKVAAEIHIGFAAKAILTTHAKSKAVNERGVLQFRMDCTKSISHVASKLLERSAVKYKLVRSLYCLNPQKMIDLPEASSKVF